MQIPADPARRWREASQMHWETRVLPSPAVVLSGGHGVHRLETAYEKVPILQGMHSVGGEEGPIIIVVAVVVVALDRFSAAAGESSSNPGMHRQSLTLSAPTPAVIMLGSGHATHAPSGPPWYCRRLQPLHSPLASFPIPAGQAHCLALVEPMVAVVVRGPHGVHPPIASVRFE